MGGNVVSAFIWDKFYWVFIVILLFNMTQRKYAGKGGKKRDASLFIGIGILVLYIYAGWLVQSRLTDLLLIPCAALLAAAGYFFRKRLFPFHIACVSCGKKLPFEHILYLDSRVCETCATREKIAAEQNGNPEIQTPE